ncbi:unannotated protein [freshwater metagenome]|uniref:Unannotated protein n=1 Tax=freshwater metagenome TaxID=449393 RepID=A0A6J7KNE7_9ZZZZ|nr:glycosyltransferase [Actinomycetota bacterium]MSW37575.1 glycosyltransferase [Actinomycetota bacterium]
MGDVIISEWLGDTGGAEQVLITAAAILPRTPIHAFSATPTWHSRYSGGRLTTTFAGRHTPPSARKFLAPAMPALWRVPRVKARRALILHHAFASSAVTSQIDLAVAYVHSPARYIWDPTLDARGSGPLARIVAAPLKKIDRLAAQRLSQVVCNSEATRARIEAHWEVPATVIYPPVRTELFGRRAPETSVASSTPHFSQGYLLSYGRWVGYKRFDHAVRVAASAGIPLVVCGGGPEGGRLRALAAQSGHGRYVTFLDQLPTAALVRLVQGARCLLFPGVEDFGIVPLEAQAAGVPVIALAAGGALETVTDGATGFLIPTLEVADWVDALERLDEIDPDACRLNAARFSEARFTSEAFDWLSAWGFDTDPAMSAELTA